MEKKVHLKIVLPSKVYKEEDVYRVLVPGENGDLTVLEERAPSVLSLRCGYIKVLGETGSEEEKIFIVGGAANIADNVCEVLTEAVVPEEHINQYGVFNYVNWRSQKERKHAVIERYQRKMKKVDERIKNKPLE